MIPINSLQNPTVKSVKALADKKGRREQGLFMAEGLAMLERAADLGWVPETLISTKPVAIWSDVNALIVTEKVMAELSGQNNPQDVLACFRPRFQPHASKSGVWLALEDIRDPGNLGTIMRTADAASVAGIILVGDCCDPHGPETVRASTGSVFAVPLVRMKTPALVDFMGGFPGETVGTSMAATVDFRRPYATPLLLVMGSESRGLSQVVTNACKLLVRIPMKSGVDSLNLATATALLVYQTV